MASETVKRSSTVLRGSVFIAAVVSLHDVQSLQVERVQGSTCANGFRDSRVVLFSMVRKTLDQFSISFDLFGCLLCLQACILAVGKAEQQVLVDEDSEKG